MTGVSPAYLQNTCSSLPQKHFLSPLLLSLLDHAFLLKHVLPDMLDVKKGLVFRASGLPATQPDDQLKASLKAAIVENLKAEEKATADFSVDIVPSCYDNALKVALVEFYSKPPAFLSAVAEAQQNEEQIRMGESELNFDRNFLGFTQLYSPEPHSPTTVEYVPSFELNLSVPSCLQPDHH